MNVGIDTCSSVCLILAVEALVPVAAKAVRLMRRPLPATFRSSWERIVARWLDWGGYAWEYERWEIVLGGGRVYVPDFSVTMRDGLVFIEVKGSRERLWKVSAAPIPTVVFGPRAVDLCQRALRNIRG